MTDPRRRGPSTGWAAAALTLLVGSVALWQLNATLQAASTGARIQVTLDTLQDVLSRLTDAETGQRGYILTGDTTYLAPYRRAIDGLQEDVDALRRLVAPDTANGQWVAQLEPFIARRLAEIDTTIKLRQTVGFEPSISVIRTNAGKNSMDSVRKVIAVLAAAEQSHLTDARQHQRASSRFAVIIIVGGSLAAFALALLAQAFVHKAGQRLRRTADSLTAANAQLEIQTRAANAASEAKSDFLAVMSHELRTPLNAILGYASLLADGTMGPTTPAQAQSVDRIRKAARSLVSLIDEILSYARLGRGNETIEINDVELGKLIEDVVGMVEHVFDAKGLPLRYRRPATACVIRTDGAKVSHILLNLLTNAAKFTTSGSVTVAIERLPTMVTIEVRDTGIGLSEADQARIFDAFTQADERRSRANEGAGLGLTIARRLARLLGGDLTVASVVGEGSAFTLSLPVYAATAAAIADQVQDATPLEV